MFSRLTRKLESVLGGPSATHVVAAVVCLFLSALSVAGGSRLTPIITWRIQTSPAALSCGASLTGALSGAASIEYNFHLDAGQLATFQIEQTGNGLTLALFAPSHQLVREFLLDEGGIRPFSLIAQRSGEYQLVFKGHLPEGYSAGYLLKWTELRVPDAGDRIRIRAEAAMSEGDFLGSHGLDKGSRSAIEKYIEAARLFAASEQKAVEAEVYLRLGNLCLLLGDSLHSSAYYNQALAISEKEKNDRLKVAALNGSAAAQTVSGAKEQALDYCSRAVALARQCHDRWGLAQALQNLGYYHSWASEFMQAQDYFQQALALRQELCDYRGEAQSVLTMGFDAADREDLARAVELYDQAKVLFQAVGDSRGLARLASAMATLYCKTGRYWEAMELYGAERARFESLDEFEISARMHNNMGVVYFEMGRFDEALAHFRRALSMFDAAGFQTSQAYTHNYVGVTLVAERNAHAAIDHHQRSVALFRKVADRRLEATSLCFLGDAYAADGQPTTARELYDEALRMFASQDDLRGQALALGSLGRLRLEAGDLQGALELSSKALAINRQIQDRYREFQTLYDIARVERDLGNWLEARTQIESAVSAVEKLRASVPGPEMRSTFFATTQQSYRLYIDVLMQIHARNPSDDLAARALEASEQARARSLLEFLSEAGSGLRRGVDPELLRRERDLTHLLNASYDQRTQLLIPVRDQRTQSVSGPNTKTQLEALEKKIAALDAEYDDLQAQIRIRSPQYAALRDSASLSQSRPLKLTQIQQNLLDEDTLLLEYALGEQRSYLWLVGKLVLRDYALPPRATIEASATRVRENLLTRQTAMAGESAKLQNDRFRRADDAYRTEAANLSRMLLGPAAAELGKKRLVIIPDGTLQYLSFGGLPSPGSGAERAPQNKDGEIRYLIADHEIVTLPSASALNVLREQAKGRQAAGKCVAVFADPVFEGSAARKPGSDDPKRSVAPGPSPQGNMQEGFSLVPLPATRQEAEAIMAMVPAGEGLLTLGTNATRERAMSPDLKNYRIIHFATHGSANDINPRMSFIALSTVDARGKPQNGLLTLLDIYNLNLSADVVVLSACSTALGKNIQGEGLVGMVRGFMYAGAARVVASLWRVDDLSTAELMKRFYRGMLQDGLSPAAALRAAQLEMSQSARWSAPYHWASFVLQGEYR